MQTQAQQTEHLDTSSLVKLYGLTFSHLSDLWDDMLPLLNKAADNNPDHDITSFINAIREKEMQLWCVFDADKPIAIMLTEIIETPKRKYVLLQECVGEGMKDWAEYIEIIKEWARSIGCRSLKWEGRKGWVRVLKGKQTGIITEIEL